MSDFKMLSPLVLQAMPLIQSAVAEGLPFDGEAFRFACGAIGGKVFGEDKILDPNTSALINVAGLAIKMRDRLILHQVRPGAAHLVGRTDLHSLPHEPPKLLRGGWLLEVKQPEKERLFGSTTVALAGYPVDGAIYLVGLHYPDGAQVVRWTPKWTGEDLEGTVPYDTSPLIEDFDQHQEWGKEAARFAVVFALLLEAEGAPVRVEVERPPAPPKGQSAKGKSSTPPAWTTAHIYLADPPKKSPAKGSTVPAGASAKVETSVEVSGHLKRQRYGPQNKETKWIYISDYAARRWVSGAPKKVVVH